MYQISTFSYLKLIFQVLNNRLPSYLNDLLQFRVYKRNLRKASTRLLQKRYGYKDMENVLSVYSTPDLWHALPVRLRINANYSYFKSNLLLLISKN